MGFVLRLLGASPRPVPEIRPSGATGPYGYCLFHGFCLTGCALMKPLPPKPPSSAGTVLPPSAPVVILWGAADTSPTAPKAKLTVPAGIEPSAAVTVIMAVADGSPRVI